jgi:hypothetical protein
MDFDLCPLQQALAMTIMLTAAALLTGAILGLRFKVLILLPATIIGSAATLGAGMAQSNTAWSVLLALALVISALQIGYFGGALIHFAGTRDRKDTAGIAVAAQRTYR